MYNQSISSILSEIKDALENASTGCNSVICDTIWMPGRPETLFDFIDRTIDEVSGVTVKSQQLELPL